MRLSIEEFVQGIEQGLPEYSVELDGSCINLDRHISGDSQCYDLHFELPLHRYVLFEECLDSCIQGIEELQTRWEDHIVRTYGEDELVGTNYA